MKKVCLLGYEMISQFRRKLKTISELIKQRSYFRLMMKLSAVVFPSWLLLIGKSYILSYEGKQYEIKRKSKYAIFRQATIADLPGIIDCTDEQLKEPLFRKYFKQNNICYVIEYKEQIVGYAWAFLRIHTITFDHYKVSNIHIALDEKTAFFGDGHINRKYRMMGLFPLLFGGTINDLGHRYSIDRFIVEVSASNLHSLKSHLRFGCKHIQTYYFVSILKKNYLFIINNKHKNEIRKINNKTKIFI